MKKLIMITALSSLIGSKALAQTWWLRRADSNIDKNPPIWSSPLVSLKECEETRKKLSNLMHYPNAIANSNKLICLEGK